MKSEVPSSRRRHQADSTVWDEVSGVRIRPASPIFVDDGGDIITSLDLKKTAAEDAERLERRQQNIDALESQRLSLRSRLFKAGLDEYKLQLALVYADQVPNPYIQKEFSRYRGLLGLAKREEIEQWAKELLAIEKSLESLRIQQSPSNRYPQEETGVRAQPVGRLAVERKSVSMSGGSPTSAPSFKGSTLAIGQRNNMIRSEQPFDAKSYRLKWQKVIQQMSPEEKAKASQRFAKAKNFLEDKRFHPINRAALQRLFGTEDIATAYALHAYQLDRAEATGVSDMGGDIAQRVYQRATRLLEHGIPTRDKQDIDRARTLHGLVSERAKSAKKNPVVLSKPRGVPPLAKELRMDRLNTFADKLVAEEQQQQAFLASEPKAQKSPAIPMTPNGEMLDREKDNDDYTEAFTSNPVSWESIDEYLDEPPTLTDLSAQFEQSFQKQEPISEMYQPQEKRVSKTESLRRRIIEMDSNQSDGSYVTPSTKSPKASIPESAKKYPKVDRDNQKRNGADENRASDIADQLMSVIVNHKPTPTEWITTELYSVPTREARAEVLEYLIKTFDLGPAYKKDIAFIKRGTHQEAEARYEKVVKRFIPVFIKSLKNKKLVTKTGVEDFVEKLQTFSVSKKAS